MSKSENEVCILNILTHKTKHKTGLQLYYEEIYEEIRGIDELTSYLESKKTKLEKYIEGYEVQLYLEEYRIIELNYIQDYFQDIDLLEENINSTRLISYINSVANITQKAHLISEVAEIRNKITFIKAIILDNLYRIRKKECDKQIKSLEREIEVLGVPWRFIIDIERYKKLNKKITEDIMRAINGYMSKQELTIFVSEAEKKIRELTRENIPLLKQNITKLRDKIKTDEFANSEFANSEYKEYLQDIKNDLIELRERCKARKFKKEINKLIEYLDKEISSREEVLGVPWRFIIDIERYKKRNKELLLRIRTSLETSYKKGVLEAINRLGDKIKTDFENNEYKEYLQDIKNDLIELRKSCKVRELKKEINKLIEYLDKEISSKEKVLGGPRRFIIDIEHIKERNEKIIWEIQRRLEKDTMSSYDKSALKEDIIRLGDKFKADVENNEYKEYLQKEVEELYSKVNIRDKFIRVIDINFNKNFITSNTNSSVIEGIEKDIEGIEKDIEALGALVKYNRLYKDEKILGLYKKEILKLIEKIKNSNYTGVEENFKEILKFTKNLTDKMNSSRNSFDEKVTLNMLEFFVTKINTIEKLLGVPMEYIQEIEEYYDKFMRIKRENNAHKANLSYSKTRNVYDRVNMRRYVRQYISDPLNLKFCMDNAIKDLNDNNTINSGYKKYLISKLNALDKELDEELDALKKELDALDKEERVPMKYIQKIETYYDKLKKITTDNYDNKIDLSSSKNYKYLWRVCDRVSMRKNVRQRNSANKLNLAKLKSMVDKAIKYLNDNNTINSEDKKYLISKLNALDKELEALNKELDALNGKLNVLDEEECAPMKYIQEIETYYDKFIKIESNNNANKTNLSSSKKYENVCDRVDRRENVKQGNIANKTNLAELKSMVDKAIEDLNDNNTINSEYKKYLIRELNALNEKLDALNEELNVLDKELEALEALDALDKEDRAPMKYIQEIERYYDKFIKIKRDNNANKTNLSSSKTYKDVWDVCDRVSMRKDVRQGNIANKTNLAELKSMVDNAIKDLNDNNTINSEYKKYLIALNEELGALNEELNVLDKELEALDKEDRAPMKYIQEIERYYDKLKKITTDNYDNKTDLSSSKNYKYLWRVCDRVSMRKNVRQRNIANKLNLAELKSMVDKAIKYLNDNDTINSEYKKSLIVLNKELDALNEELNVLDKELDALDALDKEEDRAPMEYIREIERYYDKFIEIKRDNYDNKTNLSSSKNYENVRDRVHRRKNVRQRNSANKSNLADLKSMVDNAIKNLNDNNTINSEYKKYLIALNKELDALNEELNVLDKELDALDALDKEEDRAPMKKYIQETERYYDEFIKIKRDNNANKTNLSSSKTYKDVWDRVSMRKDVRQVNTDNKSNLAYLKSMVNKAIKDLNDNNTINSEYKKYLIALNKELDALNKELDALNKELDALNKELDELNEELDELDKEDRAPMPEQFSIAETRRYNLEDRHRPFCIIFKPFRPAVSEEDEPSKSSSSHDSTNVRRSRSSSVSVEERTPMTEQLSDVFRRIEAAEVKRNLSPSKGLSKDEPSKSTPPSNGRDDDKSMGI